MKTEATPQSPGRPLRSLLLAAVLSLAAPVAAGQDLSVQDTTLPAPELSIRAPESVGLTLAALPAALFAQLVLHEMSHALTPLVRGDDFGLSLFPGGSRFGETWVRGSSRTLVAYDRGLTGFSFAAAPRILDVAIMILVPLIIDHVDSVLFRALLRAWQLAALTDFTYNTLGILGSNEASDAYRTRAVLGGGSLTAWRVGSVAAVAAAVGLTALTIPW